MKTISVVAAVIFRTNKDGTREVFATQRGYGQWKDWWEFPGGKIEEGETEQEALVREINEELATQIRVESFLDLVEYDYPDFHLSMKCYECTILSGSLELLEHENSAWLSSASLHDVNWLPADLALLEKIKSRL